MVDGKRGLKCLEAVFSGQVQGVGFRFTAQRLAEALEIKGWVKNLSDGTVQLVAEGSQDSLNKLLAQLKEHFEHDIEDVRITWQEPFGNFSEFRIVF